MYDIKGFYSIGALANNTQGQTALFGELSESALTFSRNKGQYANSSSPNVELITFETKTDVESNFILNQNTSTQVLAVGEWVYQQHIAGSIPNNTNKAAFITSLSTQFPVINNVVIGQILPGSSASRNMPDYVRYVVEVDSILYRVQVWFSNISFVTQYQGYTIFAIPPVDNLDTLNSNSATVNVALQSRTTANMVTLINAAVGNYPYTSLQTYQLNWNDPNDPAVNQIPTTWTLIIYGQAGVDSDAIKNAIREYIENNSTLTHWNLIYPELFSENEFTIIPLWDVQAIPQNAVATGIYRTLRKVSDLKELARKHIPNGYVLSASISQFLDDNLEVGQLPYQGISFTGIGNPNNNAGITTLSNLYPDLINVATTSTDFARMVNATQQFVIKLIGAIEAARVYNSTQLVPAGYTKAVSAGRVYLVFTHNNYNYLVLTRLTYNLN